MKNWKRNLLVGFIWGLIFFLWWLAGFYKVNWKFEVFSPSSWIYLRNEFLGGWVITATSDWIFVWVLLLSVPVFLIGWNICVKVQWRKTIFGFFKKIWYGLRRMWHSLFGKEMVLGKKKVKYIKKKSHKHIRPVPLHVSARALEKNKKSSISSGSSSNKKEKEEGAFDQNRMMPDFSAFGLGETTPERSAKKDNPYPSFLDEDLSNISLDDIALPEREPVYEDITDILVKAGYKVVADAQIDDMKVDYVAIDAHNIYVLVGDDKVGDWLADEEKFNGENPLWFSESSHRISPVFEMKNATDAFAERLKAVGDSHKIVPVLVVKDGTIINAEDMKQTWEQMGVVVCRTDKGGPDELPTVGEWTPSVVEAADASDIDIIRNSF